MLSRQHLGIIVRIIHYLVLLFAIFAPIIGGEFLLSLHAMAMPTMFIHWITNQNACSLTILEAHLTNNHRDNTFVADVLYPFFDIKSKNIYAIAIVLWLFGLYRLREYNFGLMRRCFNIIIKFLKDAFEFVKGLFFS